MRASWYRISWASLRAAALMANSRLMVVLLGLLTGEVGGVGIDDG